MKKEEYINNVLKHIKNKEYLATIKNELECHISDRESYYIEIGYDSQTACIKAMEHMGDADLLGEKMNRLHNDKGLKTGSYISIVLAAVVYFSYVLIFDDYLSLGSFSALCYSYAQDTIYLFIAVSILILMTISYCCALKAGQSRLMYNCAYISVFLSISTVIKEIEAIFPLADFRQAEEEIKSVNSISAIFNNYEIYKFIFALILSLCLITIFLHGVSAALCSCEFKAFEKGKGNMTVINRFDSYKKFIISACALFFVIFTVDAVIVINMFVDIRRMI